MFELSTLPPLSLYIHLPWCVRKCPYCDFNSHASQGVVLPEQAYIAALTADLEQDLPSVWGRSVSSIFIGGGTPSLFSPASIDALLSALRARLSLQPGLEITLEANPGALDAGKLNEFRAAGINRLSLGVQSFNDRLLERLGRIHCSKDALNAIAAIQAAGFDNWNLDLMFGLPGQDLRQALHDIRIAIDCQPPHLSHYQLTIEPNTRFAAQPPTLPPEDEIWAMQQQCRQLLTAQHFEPYEISAFAQPQRQCRHNLNYWHFGDYLGIGAGAHAKISDASQGTISRSWKIKHPRDYLLRAGRPEGIGGVQLLQKEDVVIEFMMNALRLCEGFPIALFHQHTGLPIGIVAAPLQQAEERGLIHRDSLNIRPTHRGQQFLNELLGLFLATDKPLGHHIAIHPAPS